MSRKVGWSGNRVGWTAEQLIDKAQEWIDRYGEPPGFDDWNLTLLRNKAEKASEDSRRAWERYARYKDGDWPSCISPKRVFGTWGKFREAARAHGIVWPDTPIAARRLAKAAAMRADQVHGAQHDDHDAADDGDDQRDVREVGDQPGAGDDPGDRGEGRHDRTVKAPS